MQAEKLNIKETKKKSTKPSHLGTKKDSKIQRYRRPSWMASIDDASFFHFNISPSTSTATATTKSYKPTKPVKTSHTKKTKTNNTHSNKNNTSNNNNNNNNNNNDDNNLDNNNNSNLDNVDNNNNNNNNYSATAKNNNDKNELEHVPTRPRSCSDPRQTRRSSFHSQQSSQHSSSQNMHNYLFHMRIQQKRSKRRNSTAGSSVRTNNNNNNNMPSHKNSSKAKPKSSTKNHRFSPGLRSKDFALSPSSPSSSGSINSSVTSTTTLSSGTIAYMDENGDNIYNNHDYNSFNNINNIIPNDNGSNNTSNNNNDNGDDNDTEIDTDQFIADNFDDYSFSNTSPLVSQSFSSSNLNQQQNQQNQQQRQDSSDQPQCYYYYSSSFPSSSSNDYNNRSSIYSSLQDISLQHHQQIPQQHSFVDSSPSSPSMFHNIFDTPPESPESASFNHASFDMFSDTSSSYISSPSSASPVPDFSGLSLSTTPDASPVSPHLALDYFNSSRFANNNSMNDNNEENNGNNNSNDNDNSPVRVENLVISGENAADCDAVSQLDVQNSIEAAVESTKINQVAQVLADIGLSFKELELTFRSVENPLILVSHDCLILWTSPQFDDFVGVSRYSLIGYGGELETGHGLLSVIIAEIVQNAQNGSDHSSIALPDSREIVCRRESMESSDGSIAAWMWLFTLENGEH